jgi:hypothetical protein
MQGDISMPEMVTGVHLKVLKRSIGPIRDFMPAALLDHVVEVFRQSQLRVFPDHVFSTHFADSMV